MRKRTASLAYENKHRAVIEKLFFEILIFFKGNKVFGVLDLFYISSF